MGHCYVSSSPSCFVFAPVGLVGKQEQWHPFWIPACTGMTTKVSPLPGREKLLHSVKVLRNILAEWRRLLVTPVQGGFKADTSEDIGSDKQVPPRAS